MEYAPLLPHLFPFFCLPLTSTFPLRCLKLNGAAPAFPKRRTRPYREYIWTRRNQSGGALDVANEPGQVARRGLMGGRAADAASVQAPDDFSNYSYGNLLEKAPDCWEGPNETG